MSDAAARFWSRVGASGGPEACWLWDGCTDGNGYGLLKFDGRVIRSHRLAFRLASGLPIEGRVVMHACDVPRCCNPAHLSLGTRADNNRDRDRKGRHVVHRTPRPDSAKLRADDVLRIRELLASARSILSVAKEYGVCANTINDIRTQQTWRHV